MASIGRGSALTSPRWDARRGSSTSGAGAVTCPLRLARLADRDGLDVEWLGVDPDPRAIAVAAERTAPRVTFRCTDAATLLSEEARFDIVLSNHVLHHLSAVELRAFADDSLGLSAGMVVHSDIRRSRLAYGLYNVAVTPFAPGTFLRTDGSRSIRRSYRAAELAAVLGDPWQVSNASPFRILAVGTDG